MSGPNNKVPIIMEDDYEENKDKYHAEGKSGIVIPDGPETEDILKRIANPLCCGDCKYFDLRTGQEEIYNTDFITELIREREMGSMAGAHAWNLFGVCHKWSNGSQEYHITHVHAAPRINRWKLEGSSVTHEHKDDSVECPYYTHQKGKNIRSRRMVNGARTIGTD